MRVQHLKLRGRAVFCKLRLPVFVRQGRYRSGDGFPFRDAQSVAIVNSNFRAAGAERIYPDSVSLVSPPNMTIPNTLAALANSQYATTLSLTSGKRDFAVEALCSSDRAAVVDSDAVLKLGKLLSWLPRLARYELSLPGFCRNGAGVVRLLNDLVMKLWFRKHWRQVKKSREMRGARLLNMGTEPLKEAILDGRGNRPGIKKNRNKRNQLSVIAKSRETSDLSCRRYLGTRGVRANQHWGFTRSARSVCSSPDRLPFLVADFMDTTSNNMYVNGLLRGYNIA